MTATNYRTQAEVVGKSLALIGAGWDEVVGADWAHPKGPATDTKGKEDHPVVHVSWDDAIAFSVWAAKKMGTAIRLHSEAEWEKAARGADGRKYPWGDAAPTSALANFNNAIGANTPVGKYSPAGDSPYGCVDMVGNAWQWVNSLHKPYPYSATDGRESATDRGARTLRGSGFNNTIELVYAALRVGYGPSNHDELTGFRVCASSV